MKANGAINIGLRLETMAKIEESGDHAIRVHLAALEYVRLGWYVVPLRPNQKLLPPKEMGNFTYGKSSRNKKIIDKWFHPHDGIFAGWNIGIATGRQGGVFAIDIDVHGAEDGFLSKDRLEEENGSIPMGPRQKTPSGGMHILFNWQEHATNSTSKLAPAIDTRGGEESACKGHIVAYPSAIEGKQYEWIEGGALPDIPAWVMERMGVRWKPRSAGNRGNENVGEDDLEKPLEKAQIKRMLEAIDPNDLSYNDWLRVGMSIRSQYHDDSGLELWDEWSIRGSRYKEGECRIRWDGLDLSGSVRAGTLFYLAKEAGWQREQGDRQGNQHDEVVERLNNQFAIVTVGGKIRVLREKDYVSDPILGHYDLLNKDDFKTLLQNDTVIGLDRRGNPREISVADIWLGHIGRREYPNGVGMFPDNKIPEGYYNTWNGWSINPREGNCDLFLKHIEGVICNGNPEYYTWIMDWCADYVQHPASPKGCAIVLRGGEGVGKGTFASTLGELAGSHYRHLIDDSHLLSNFNAHMIDALFVFADEITWGGNKKTSGKLKGMVTERYLVGERKGVDAVGYRNMIHMVIASNSEWVIPAGADSRRWFMLDVPKLRTGDISYFEDIMNELDNGGREALLHFLLNRKIKSNLRVAPVTKALKDQRIRSSESDTVVTYWIEMVIRSKLNVTDSGDFDPNNPAGNEWPGVVEKSDLYDNYVEWCNHKKVRPQHIVTFANKLLNDMGFSQKRVNINGKRVRIFQTPMLDKAREILENKFNVEFEIEDENES